MLMECVNFLILKAQGVVCFHSKVSSTQRFATFAWYTLQ